MADYKYVLAYKLPENSSIEVEVLDPDDALLRLNELFYTEFASIDEILDALEYGEINISDFDGCTMFTLATTFSEILYTAP